MFIYLVLINLVSALFMIFDKVFAKYNKYRISEKTLYLLSFLGGVIGMYIVGEVIRHKTLKTSFKLVYILSLIIWIFILLLGDILWKKLF